MELIKDKRYEWYINHYENKKKNGLLLTRNGEKWSIPVKDLEVII